MDKLRDRIDYIRKDSGLSYKELAELIGGISGDGLRKAIIRASSKDEYYAKRIAEEIGYSKEWVIEGKGEMKNNDLRKTNFEDPRLYFLKDGVKIYIDEIVDFMEEDFDYLITKSIKYKFFMGDKTNSLMFQFFKEHGIEVKVTNDVKK